MLDLSESRAQIDVIDKEITRLFQKRQQCAVTSVVDRIQDTE